MADLGEAFLVDFEDDDVAFALARGGKREPRVGIM